MNIFQGESKPYIFGHRGYSKIAPENTMAAFNELLKRKVPGVELDVHLCRSGELVVTHDDNLKRVTGLDAIVEDLDYNEIKKLDAGSWKDERFRGERIPLLRDVFDFLGNKVYYDIELKTMSTKPTDLPLKVFELIKLYNLQERCIVSSFNPIPLKHFKQITKAIPTATIFSDNKEVPWFLRHGEGRWIASSDLLKPNKKKLNKTNLFLYKAFIRKEIIAWTVDDAKEADRLIKAGISGLISNDPSSLGLLGFAE